MTFCPQCGFAVAIDKDGMCVSCGATATGSAADELIKALLALADEWPEDHDPSGDLDRGYTISGMTAFVIDDLARFGQLIKAENGKHGVQS